jgi:succinate dehydrogenase / fumarate reductase iron-sulfur subunit
MEGNMSLSLKVWRQSNKDTAGGFENYKLDHVSPDMSFLEMFDVLNEQLIEGGNRACII